MPKVNKKLLREEKERLYVELLQRLANAAYLNAIALKFLNTGNRPRELAPDTTPEQLLRLVAQLLNSVERRLSLLEADFLKKEVPSKEVM